MMSRFMGFFTDTHLTLIGFVIFFVLFIFFVLSTYLPGQVELHRRLSLLPLEKEDRREP